MALSAAQQAKPTIGNGPTLQASKSAATRARLIEATIRCIVKYGYARTTTPRVADEAGMSRGAMLHHFENGSALMQAAIAELHEKRLMAFRRSAGSTVHDVRNLVRAYWKQVSSQTFTAFHELAIAARTDHDLANILVPAQEDFRNRWYRQAIELFPEWQGDRARFDLALALSQNVLEGMAINRLTHGIDDAMVEPILCDLERQIEALKPIVSAA
ncbi:TetR/AcrR family transcriptional regulator [Sphingomonas sp. 28-63-12]|uniref:TetR/AcrR family transcriptional regulator n=1 Tax=Sphingomonas sp. 28-63-12 TaxID=1970434 RepID=UPI000BDC791D|nr:MAG: TetR family transcriptional regulator [Sphingomonas sp. 28-63-12]